MKGLGRRYAPDPRDRLFPMRAVLPRRSARTYRYWWDSGAWLNQLGTGTCGGHGGAHWCEDSPVTPAGTILGEAFGCDAFRQQRASLEERQS